MLKDDPLALFKRRHKVRATVEVQKLVFKLEKRKKMLDRKTDSGAMKAYYEDVIHFLHLV